MNDRKVFEEKIKSFIDVMSYVTLQAEQCHNSELTCDNDCRYLKRKREMESSTPLDNKRRETFNRRPR